MRWIGSAAVIAGALLAAGEARAFLTPEALIRAVYLPMLAGQGAPPPRARLFSADTLRLFAAFDARNPGGLGFSPLIDGQDFDLAGLGARQVRLDAVSADLVVSFTNFGEPTQLTYSMVREADGWRVFDISGMWASGPWSVRELLAADPSRLALVEAATSR